ncbi:MAG: hypothetical protein K2N47_04580, partial [Clostridia bacterium]|nr:hypothetical protein [Clostridia bacterium]
NVVRLYSVNFFNNPKREIKKIKDLLDKLTSSKSNLSSNFKRTYRAAKMDVATTDANGILSGNLDADLIKTIKAVVVAEEPISSQFLIKRVLAQYGITKYGTRLEGKIASLIPACALKSQQLLGTTHYYKNDKAIGFDKYRVEEGTSVRTNETDFSPYDVIALIKALLVDRVSMYRDELILAAAAQLKSSKPNDKFSAYVSACIDESVSEGMFIRSVSDRISLA